MQEIVTNVEFTHFVLESWIGRCLVWPVREDCQRYLTRSEVLNTVFKERPKLLALGWSLLGDGPAAERVFRELLVALDERSENFPNGEGLLAWCWDALRDRCLNLVDRGDGRRVMLSDAILELVDRDLRARDADEVADQGEALEVCLGDLAQRSRWIVHLYYAKGKGGLESARMLNVKPEQLYRDLQKVYVGGAQCLLKRIAMGRNPLGRVRARSTEFERLVVRYLDDELTEERVEQMALAMLEDPDHIRQFNDIRLYTVLMRDACVNHEDPDHALAPPSTPEERPAVSVLVSLVVAAVFMAGLVGSLALIKLNPEEAAAATLVRGAGAKFATRAAPKIGEALDSENYVLTMGTIQLRFAKGAEVNIEAPAGFRIDSEDRLVLDHGTLLAMVPTPAIGFEVATKFGTIRDLGTEFGVTVRPNQSTEVAVFQGAVELSVHGTPAARIRAGRGHLVTPSGITPLSSSSVAFRYPRTLPSGDTKSSSGGIVANASFEVGPLSRAPMASHRYRDLPSHWTGGFFEKDRWRNQVDDISHVGTVVAPFNGSADLSPPHGERCLYLDRAAVRQRIDSLRPGGKYTLTFMVASPATDTQSPPLTCEVGVLSGSLMVESERATVKPGLEFTEVEFDLAIPDEATLAGEPLHLALSAKDGLVFFDEVRLTEASGEE